MTARGLLLVVADPAPSIEEEFNAWYDTEHLPERAALPGFHTAMRFTSLGAGPRYAALYDLTDLGVLDSAPYQAVSGANFSPWTRRVMARAHPARMTARLVAGTAAPTGPCPRLMILKFRDCGAANAAQVMAGLEASLPHARCRVFAGAEPSADFLLAVVESPAPTIPPLGLDHLGEARGRLAMAATYRPYRG